MIQKQRAFRVYIRWTWALLYVSLITACSGWPGQESSNTPPVATQPPVVETTTQFPTQPSSEPPRPVTSLPATPTASESTVPRPSETPTKAPISFAVIGDYGSGDANEAAVAELVLSWGPDIILTLGDNNYPIGSADTIDDHIGQFYNVYIHPYKGTYGEGAVTNRFFPALGNHDWMSDRGKAYLDYFSLPGNERYYDFTWGAVQFFAVNNESNEPDGVGRSSVQAAWLREQLERSAAEWQVVYMHFPAYSSGYHGSTDWAQWPYGEWGADAVLAGHDHTYERLIVDGIPYFVNGLGGGAIYSFGDIVPQSVMRFNDTYGALWGQASESKLEFQFISIDGEIVDVFEIQK